MIVFENLQTITGDKRSLEIPSSGEQPIDGSRLTLLQL